MPTTARRLILALVLVVSAAIFLIGITWGLPSRETDVFLLGKNRDNLHLESLTAAVPPVDAKAGADVTTPAGPADQIVPLNDTDAKRAQILCRYRLYSFQPDEMITFRSLSQMKPSEGDLDPRLYQYGGLWIYGVAGIVEAGHVFGLLDIADRPTYIGNPELFGKLYVAARAYSALWGVIGVWAVFAIVRRLTPDRAGVALLAALSFAVMPVVVTLAHEAKPHLAGCTLILLAVLGADNYLQTKKIHWAWITGAVCGAAAGMVLWAAVAVILIPVLAVLARKPLVMVIATITALAVYGVTNPYVVIHLFHDPSVLQSNLSNTSAMYHFNRPDLALWNALQLICAGAGPLMLPAGLIGAALLARRGGGPLVNLLGSAAIAIGVPFILFAAGKPGEYGRFALLPDVVLLIVAAVGLARCNRAAIPALVVLLLVTTAFGHRTLIGFQRDAADVHSTSRWQEADHLQSLLDAARAQSKSAKSALTLGVFADPAPYGLPPVDLDGWRIVHLPADYDMEKALSAADVVVRPIQSVEFWESPISWADKRFEVSQRPLKP